MAILIQQSPTSFNMANNNLVFSVTSSQVTQSQFQFVADLTYSGSATVLQRVKQQPNPNARGVFDFGSIITNYLEEEKPFTITKFMTGSLSAKRFQVKFGEQYGTSVSSSVTLYNGAGAVGNPAVTASIYTLVMNGLVEPNDKVNWNFPSQSFYTPTTTPTGGFFAYQNALTDAPFTQSIRLTDYQTISIFNGNLTPNTSSAQDIYAVNYSFYSSSGAFITSSEHVNLVSNGGGPRNVAGNLWSLVGGAIGTYNNDGVYGLIHAAAGPANISSSGITIPTNTAYYKVDLVTQAGASTANTTGSFASYQFNIVDPNCGYDGVRFAWKNKYGNWDYYTFTLQNDKLYGIERSTYQQSFVPFGDNSPVAYNPQRRGNTNYYNKLTKIETANSDWLTQEESDWLRELFFSANVYQQSGSSYYPVVISSVDVTEKTNPRTQQLFQYNIEFQPANQPNPRI